MIAARSRAGDMREMDFFASTGFRPLRTMTRAICLMSSSGCSGVSLMSRSFMDLTRFQSVLEVLEEDAFFMSGCSPKRDHVNAFAGFQVHDRNGNPIQQTQGDETLLAIGKTIVFIGRRGPFEYAPGIGEVKPVIRRFAFRLRWSHVKRIYGMYIRLHGLSSARPARLATHRSSVGQVLGQAICASSIATPGSTCSRS